MLRPLPRAALAFSILHSLFAILQASAETPLPSAPPGFKVSLFARDPDIVHPTALATAPGGVVFVAEEFWNAHRPGVPETSVIKRFVDRDGDGVADEMKVFWGANLASIQGLRWFDGTLYAMHAPTLSAFRDRDGDGAAEERKNILVGRKPDSRNRIAGHLISGITAWIDGRLYITCGDEGWWKCKTPEGREFEIHGGGILRCRPDGTGLEAYCTGLRNPYGTMAIDADGNGFTRDNTNDGQGWNVRFSQIFHHAFYGYPYHFKNYPEEIVPCLEDYGDGSPTGGICYLEDQFPEEYRGNLFFNEWGRRVVIRKPLRRDGVVLRPTPSDFLTGGSEGGYEFRPIAIDVDENGSLLVADWAMGGWGTGTGKGRVLRVTYVGDGRSAVTPPRPPEDKPIDGWISDLASPRFSARFRAQRELERAGAAAAGPLRQALADGSVDARIHAMWALAHVEKESAVPDLLPQLESSEERVRLHAARILGDGGVGTGGADALVTRLANDTPRMRVQAALALGALRAAEAAPALLKAAAHDDVFVHHTIAYALRATGDRDACLQALDDPDPRVRDASLIALRERFEPPIVAGLARAARAHPDPAFRVRALRALVRVGKRPQPWDGEYWSFWPKVGSYPFGTEPWEGTPDVARAVAALAGDPDREVRIQAAIGLRHLREPAGAGLLASALPRERDEGVAGEIVAALDSMRSPEAFDGLAAFVKQSDRLLALRLRALMVLGAIPDLPPDRAAAREALTNELLQALSTGDAALKREALRGLGHGRAAFAAPWIAGRLGDPDEGVREAALRALADVGDAGRGLPAARRLFADASPAVRRGASAAFVKLTPPDGDLTPLATLLQDADLTVVREVVAALLQKKGGAAGKLAESLLTPFLRRWIVIGPFPNGEGRGFAAVYPPEVEISPEREVDGDGGRVRWHEIVSDGDAVPLQVHIATRDQVAGYAATAVEASEAHDVLLLLGSDDGVKVWVNGEPVHVKDVHRGAKPDEDLARARLRKGLNTVLVKVTNGSGPWGFYLRIADPMGRGALAFPDPRGALAATRKARLMETALRGGGDPAAGGAVFRDAKAGCVKCHAARGEGAKIGPDLTAVGAKYLREHLAESVLYPSRKLAQGFQAISVVTKDERVLSGIVTEETPEKLVLAGSDGTLTEIPKNEVASRHPQGVSIMPEGIERDLTDGEFLDLVAFLESLKQ